MRNRPKRSTVRKLSPLLVALVAGVMVLASAGVAYALVGYQVVTFAGTAGVTGSTDALGPAASFNDPSGVAVGSGGTVYVADTFNSTIRKITSGGLVSTFAGTAGSVGATNGVGAAASFNAPIAVAVDATGNVYVADTGNNTIRKITSGGSVSTLAGTAGSVGATDGVGAAASFDAPSAVAVDGSGNVFVADAGSSIIRKITPGGSVSTLAGTAYSFGSLDGQGAAAQFLAPQGIAVGTGGNVFVADTGNSTIREIDSLANVTTFAGTAGTFSYAEGTGAAAFFNSPEGVAVDTGGNVWVSDSSNELIRVLTPGAVSSTIAGSLGVAGSLDGFNTSAQFNLPWGIAVDNSGVVYVADSLNNTIRKMAQASATFAIVPTAGLHGTIAPNTTQTVAVGANATFTITPDLNYHIANVLVDGVSVGTPSSYTFVAVTASHTIDASFAINTFTIGATAGAGGTISPSGTQTVNAGTSATFTITPNTGYHVVSVLVDGISQGAISSYTFTNVQTNHTISATFAINTYTLAPSAGANGSISPATTQTVNFGTNTTFTITPNASYHVASVLVDGVSQGAITTYTFTNVQANHTISATFAINGDFTPPTTISDAVASYVNTATIHLTATDNAGGSGVAHTYYKVDAGAQTEGTTIVVATYGNHGIEFWSVDASGNIETPHKTAAFFIDDNVAPSTTSDAVSTYTGSATIHLTGTDNVGGSGIAHVYYKLDGGPQLESTTIAVNALGSHSLEFWSVDVAANAETPHHTVSFTIIAADTIAPSTTSDAVATYVVTATIHLTATDNVGGSGVAHTYYKVDGGAQTEGTTIVVTGLGVHSIEFWSVDVAANVETPHKTASFTITVADTTAPITTSDAVASYVNTATIHLTAADNVGGSGVAHTYYKVDGGAQTEGTTIVVNGAGAHGIEFWSVDVAANIETPHKTANFTITTGPQPTSITIRTNATSVTRGKSFILSGVVVPASLVGTNIQVMVKYPTKAYYSYSSLRTCYMNGAVPSWWYRYTAVKTQPAGVFKFYAFVPASAMFAYSKSPVLNVTFK